MSGKPRYAIYVNGCTTCGYNRTMIRLAKKKISISGGVCEVYNSSRDIKISIAHLYYQNQSGISTSQYYPIIVHNGNVMLLDIFIK